MRSHIFGSGLLDPTSLGAIPYKSVKTTRFKTLRENLKGKAQKRTISTSSRLEWLQNDIRDRKQAMCQ